jgi:hypothetical protein
MTMLLSLYLYRTNQAALTDVLTDDARHQPQCPHLRPPQFVPAPSESLKVVVIAAHGL